VQLILIVQGKTEIGQTMQCFLTQANYAVRLFTRAIDIVAEAERQRPALICIEIGASATSGIDLYSLIRAVPSLANTPVILFSSGTGDEERILALESGADDYIGQPFTRGELIAQVKAVLRRFTQSSPRSASLSAESYRTAFSEGMPELITMGDIQIDTSGMKVLVRGAEVATTALEFRLMHYLAKHQYQVFTRDQLLDAVWGNNRFVTPQSVDACIRRIRCKIEPDRTKPTYLKTVRGAGYLLDLTPASRRYASAGRNAAGRRGTSATPSPAVAMSNSVFRPSLKQA